MTSYWDEFSKSLVEESVPRRESLRRLGIALAGAVLSPLGLQTASAGHHSKQQTNLCKTFCKCRNKRQQDQCLKACSACGKDPSRLGGSCGNYYCCSAGQTSCGNYCADLGFDPYNCGACGYVCEEPGPYEYGACVDGECRYTCVEGAAYCNGFCTFLGWDSNNCGACGNVCPESAPYCNQGECADCPPGTALCGGQCVDLVSDASNCGGCGQACPTGHVCSGGVCCNPTISDCSQCTPSCPEGWCGGDGCGGACACPDGWYCESNGWCANPCIFPFILCDGICVDPTSNRNNCGGCGSQCADDEVCMFGFCQSF
jgi:hypothetical protein